MTFSTLWEKLSPRERVLIAVAAGLVAILLLSLLLVRPVLSYKAAAELEFEEAASTYTLVARAAATPTAPVEADSSVLRSTLTTTANRGGIIINRINSEGAGIDLSIGNTPVARLYDWLAVLENEHGVFVQDAAIRPANDGRSVTARLTVVRGR